MYPMFKSEDATISIPQARDSFISKVDCPSTDWGFVYRWFHLASNIGLRYCDNLGVLLFIVYCLVIYRPRHSLKKRRRKLSSDPIFSWRQWVVQYTERGTFIFSGEKSDRLKALALAWCSNRGPESLPDAEVSAGETKAISGNTDTLYKDCVAEN